MTPSTRRAWGATTHVGARRKLNEDSYLAHSPVFIVADGMGGHQQGEVASALATEEFATLTQYNSLFPEQVDSCFGRAAARLRSALPGGIGGTTVCGVAITFQGSAAYWLVFNLGDSRVYHLSAAGNLAQISVDHSVVQEMLDAGSLSVTETQTHAERHVITRALETMTEPEPDYWLIPIESGDQILLCSDGLTDEVDDPTIRQIWRSGDSAQQASENLVAAAFNAGGRDNITTVIVTSEVVPNLAQAAPATTHSGWANSDTEPLDQIPVVRSQNHAY